MHKPPKRPPNFVMVIPPELRATAGHIREAIRYALWEKTEIGGKSDDWYAKASEVSRRWRDDCRTQSLKTLARQYLEYWRYRAFLGVRDVAAGTLYPCFDAHARREWLSTGSRI